MIKKTLKWVGITFCVALIVGGAFATHEWNAEKPFYLNNLLNRELVKLGMNSPEGLTSLGFLESVGIKGHNGKLDDASLAQEYAMMHQLDLALESVGQYSDDELDFQERLSKQIVEYLGDYYQASKPFIHHSFPINQMFGLQSNYPSFMDSQHQVDDKTDAENYIKRLIAVKRQFTQVMETLEQQQQKGIVPPRFVIDRVLDEMNAFVDEAIEDNILYASFVEKMSASDNFDKSQREDFSSEAKLAIKESVHPAYQLFIEHFTSLREIAGTDDGVWRLPDGDKYYQNELKFYTTTDYTPDQVHTIGLSEVDRIQALITTILAAQGYDISGGFLPSINALSAEEKFYYPDTDEGRESILADYQAILNEIDAGLDDAFNIRPKAGMEVKRVPEFKEKTAPGAYYQQGSIDGSRPGRFSANLYDIKATPRYGMRTLAYHEGIPGHHFQVSIGMELKGLPFLRVMSPFTAFVEGWALYAEALAAELGFQNDPFDNIGRLQAELFRAVRLVVDTGIHSKRWTREEAITYMLNNTGMADSDVVSEIERYIVMPGQATAYKVGMMKIMTLREKAKTTLGDKFDLKAFHDVVLKNGSVPLDILETLINRYIDDVKEQATT